MTGRGVWLLSASSVPRATMVPAYTLQSAHHSMSSCGLTFAPSLRADRSWRLLKLASHSSPIDQYQYTIVERSRTAGPTASKHPILLNLNIDLLIS
jgi:hypothetical protein